MKIKTLIPLVLVTLATTPALADVQNGGSAENPSDQHAGVFEQRVEQRVQQARDNTGNGELANRMKQRSDEMKQRFDEKGDRIKNLRDQRGNVFAQRMDNRRERINRRMERRAGRIQQHGMNHQQRHQ